MAFLPESNFCPGQIIIGFNEETSSDEVKRVIEGMGVEIISEISPNDIILVRVPNGQEQDYIQMAQSQPHVSFAELNYKRQLMGAI